MLTLGVENRVYKYFTDGFSEAESGFILMKNPLRYFPQLLHPILDHAST